MGLTANAKTYRSPDYKLLPFFNRSRDGWKAKAQARNLRIKRLKNRVAALEESRGKWKEKARAYESRIAALEEDIEEQKRPPPLTHLSLLPFRRFWRRRRWPGTSSRPN